MEGRGYTLRDGDLRVWTWVDVVPVVCKQGVRGSSPLSSTGQKPNSKSRAHTGQVQQQSTATGTAVRCRTRVRAGPCPRGRRRTDSRSWGPSSGPLSRKNAFGRAQCRLPAASRQRAESAVSRPVLAAHTEGQRMAAYFRHLRLGILVTLHEFTARLSPNTREPSRSSVRWVTAPRSFVMPGRVSSLDPMDRAGPGEPLRVPLSGARPQPSLERLASGVV